jgi:hypothetical protein
VGDGSGADAATAVTGVSIRTYVTDDNALPLPTDFANTPIGVWSLSRSGDWRYIPGSSTSDGKFSVPAVPGGRFVLKIGAGVYYASSTARSFDLSSAALGRADRVRAVTKPTTLSLELDGLGPWQPTDRLAFYAAGVGAFEGAIDGKITPSILDGAVRLEGTVDYMTFEDPQLVDGPGRNDDAWVVQLASTMTEDKLPYLAASKVYRTRTLQQRDGRTAVLAGAFADARKPAPSPSTGRCPTWWAWARRSLPPPSTPPPPSPCRPSPRARASAASARRRRS